MNENEKLLGSLQLKAYGLYQIDWCADHMASIQEYDFETGFGGECFACFDEFMRNEFQDKEMMRMLLPPKLFQQYRELYLGEVSKDA